MRHALAVLALIATVAMTGCGTPPPPPAPPAPPAAPPPAPPPSAPPPVRQPVSSTWQFKTGESCDATADSLALSLRVHASADRLVFTVTASRRPVLAPRAAVPLAFVGSAGNWTADGHLAGAKEIGASEPMTAEAVSRVLVLLGGGLMRVGNPHDNLPALRIPNAGAAGRAWFECVKRLI